MDGNDLRHILSNNLKLLRNKRSLSQMELAEKAGISVTFLSNIERDNKWPYPETLMKLAEALDVEVHILFQNSKTSKPANLDKVMPQFKKDLESALHKKVLSAIDSSLNSICSVYMEETQGESLETEKID